MDLAFVTFCNIFNVFEVVLEIQLKVEIFEYMKCRFSKPIGTASLICVAAHMCDV